MDTMRRRELEDLQPGMKYAAKIVLGWAQGELAKATASDDIEKKIRHLHRVDSFLEVASDLNNEMLEPCEEIDRKIGEAHKRHMEIVDAQRQARTNRPS